MQSFKIEIKSVAIVLIAMIVGAILSFQHGGFAALVIILFSLGGYAFLWLKTGNATHILGLMYLGFVLPMGVANFRLAAYQSLWEMGTWWCFILATAMFSSGFVGGEMIMSRCLKEECRDFLHKENAFSEKAYLWLASILFFVNVVRIWNKVLCGWIITVFYLDRRRRLYKVSEWGRTFC